MDVTSLVIAVALVGQTTGGDRYPSYTTPGAASLSTPTYTPAASSPASPGYAPPATGVAPSSAPPGYPPSAPPSTPVYNTAAAEKRPPTTSGTTSAVPGSLPATTVAPITTPVPTGAGATTASPAATSSSSIPGTPPAAAPAARPAVPESARAVELVREAITIPTGAKLEVDAKGRTLFETLAPLGDRRAQHAAIVGYWKLAADTAEYHFDWQQTKFWEYLQQALSSRGNDPTTAAEVGSRLATAQAQLRESELRLYDTQYEFAQRVWHAQGATAPLTVDLPHTGSYNTQFKRLFGGGAPSGRIVLLNLTLPMRQQVVNARADSVTAAQNGYEQTFAAFQQGRLPAEEVMAALDDFRRRRTEFITAVRRYNEEIAEYALTSAPEGISTATLVGMLLKNPTKPAASAVSDASLETPFIDAAVAPVSYVEGAPATGTPTLAPPMTPRPDPISSSAPISTPAAPSASPYGVPTNTLPTSSIPPPVFIPANDAAPLAPGSVPPPITAEMQHPTSQEGRALPVANAPASNPLRGTPTLAPPPTTASAPMSASPTSAVVPATATNPYASPASSPVPTSPASPSTPSSPPGMLPPFIPSAPASSPSPQQRYRVHTTNFQSASGGVTRAQATQDLVESLYDPQATPLDGTPISLEACLAKVAAHDRTETLAIYWYAAEQRARYRVWGQAVNALNQASPPSPRIQAAALAAEAERTESLIALNRARLHLTENVQHSHDEPWLLPETLPHGGRYDTKSAALAKRIAADPRLRRDVERLPTLHETLQWRAEAVTNARTAAQSAVGRLAAQQTTAHIALEAVERQARETCELLETTTRYNLTIADYAIGVLPATTPRDTLVSALVVGRNAVASRP